MCHFVFGSHQSKPPLHMHGEPLATDNSNTYLTTLTLKSFDRYRSFPALHLFKKWRKMRGYEGGTGFCSKHRVAYVILVRPSCSKLQCIQDCHSSDLYSFTDHHYIAIYKRYLCPTKAVHSASLVKVKAGSDTMIHTPQLKDSLHLN